MVDLDVVVTRPYAGLCLRKMCSKRINLKGFLELSSNSGSGLPYRPRPSSCLRWLCVQKFCAHPEGDVADPELHFEEENFFLTTEVFNACTSSWDTEQDEPIRDSMTC